MSKDFKRMTADDRRLLNRYQQELTGIAEGVLADGVLNNKEILFLKSWFEEDEKKTLIAFNPPGDDIYERLCDLLGNDVIDEGKRESFVKALEELGGEYLEETEDTAEDPIPFEFDEVDNVEFEDKTFYFTGTFLFRDAGTKKGPLNKATRLAGGEPGKFNQSLNYLVVGTKLHPQWSNKNYGTKIVDADKWRKAEKGIKMIRERVWVKHLPTQCR